MCCIHFVIYIFMCHIFVSWFWKKVKTKLKSITCITNNSLSLNTTGQRSKKLRFTPAAKSFSTFITVRLVVCLKIHLAANSIVTRATITWRRPEIRKFAQNTPTHRSTDRSTDREFNYRGHSYPLWIVGVSGPILLHSFRLKVF